MKEIDRILDRILRKDPFNPLRDYFDLFPFSNKERNKEKEKYFSNRRLRVS